MNGLYLLYLSILYLTYSPTLYLILGEELDYTNLNTKSTETPKLSFLSSA